MLLTVSGPPDILEMTISQRMVCLFPAVARRVLEMQPFANLLLTSAQDWYKVNAVNPGRARL